MNTLSVQNIHSHGKDLPCAFHGLREFTYTFTFGKSYLLDGWPWDGGDTLSWIIGGAFEPDGGSLLKDGAPFGLAERQKVGWLVRRSTIKVRKLPFQEVTVQDQIRHGLKTVGEQYLRTEEDIMRRFRLTPERYKRPMRTLSHEGWRASCIIGLANGRKIFCFPYLRPDFVREDHYLLWLKPLIDLLKEAGGLVLIPTTAIGIKAPEALCDEIVQVKPDFSE